MKGAGLRGFLPPVEAVHTGLDTGMGAMLVAPGEFAPGFVDGDDGSLLVEHGQALSKAGENRRSPFVRRLEGRRPATAFVRGIRPRRRLSRGKICCVTCRGFCHVPAICGCAHRSTRCHSSVRLWKREAPMCRNHDAQHDQLMSASQERIRRNNALFTRNKEGINTEAAAGFVPKVLASGHCQI